MASLLAVFLRGFAYIQKIKAGSKMYLYLFTCLLSRALFIKICLTWSIIHFSAPFIELLIEKGNGGTYGGILR